MTGRTLHSMENGTRMAPCAALCWGLAARTLSHGSSPRIILPKMVSPEGSAGGSTPLFIVVLVRALKFSGVVTCFSHDTHLLFYLCFENLLGWLYTVCRTELGCWHRNKLLVDVSTFCKIDVRPCQDSGVPHPRRAQTNS